MINKQKQQLQYLEEKKFQKLFYIFVHFFDKPKEK